MTLATRCDYLLTAGLPTVSQDLTIDGSGATLERSYAPGTPAFTILAITGGSVTIDDLEIRNGDNGITLSGPGAAITVNHSVFVGNHGTDGGAISSNTGVNGPVVSESLFIANQATDAGGAIYNNSALDGVVVTGSTFRDNVAVGDGGAIFDFSAIGEQLTGSLIEGNRASEGGGIWFSPNSGMSISQDTISGNDATGNGGGIAAVNFSSLQLQDSTITGNRAVDGGGLYATIGDQEIITDSSFIANTAQNGEPFTAAHIRAKRSLEYQARGKPRHSRRRRPLRRQHRRPLRRILERDRFRDHPQFRGQHRRWRLQHAERDRSRYQLPRAGQLPKQLRTTRFGHRVRRLTQAGCRVSPSPPAPEPGPVQAQP